jgi:hypothetical protein
VPDDKWWKKNGVDPHEIKDGQGDSRRNLGVDKRAIFGALTVMVPAIRNTKAIFEIFVKGS